MLLDEIIDLLGSGNGNLTDALLKTKILLHQIGTKELTEWVNNELNGYPENSELPPYRIISAQVLANVSNGAWRASSHPIPIGHLRDDQKEKLETSPMPQSLEILQEYASKGDNGNLMRPLPMEANGLLDKGLGNGFRVERAWCDINRSEIKGILANVRSRLLDFLLNLKDTIGDVETDTAVKERVSSSEATNLFNHAIFGSNTTIVVGHHNIQTVRSANSVANLDELAQTLRQGGIPTDEIDGLRQAISADEAAGKKPSFEGNVGTWFTKLLSRATKGGLKIGVDVASEVATKALKDYFGG